MQNSKNQKIIGENKGIFAQVDNFTAMFYNCKINDVFDFLQLDISKYYGDLYRERKMFSNMCAYQFQWNGVNVQAQNVSCIEMMKIIENNDAVSSEYAPDLEDFVDVFELTLNAIRLELTGTGLEYMREFVNPEIDDYLRNKDLKPDNMKVTRIDFAYDFINYMPGILDAIIEYAQAYCSDSGRVLTYGGRGYKCDVTTVGQKKVILGSVHSNKLLRIYDKRLEQMDSRREVYKKPNKYNNPNSWIRFEFQCRKDTAHTLCYGSSENPDSYQMPGLFSIFKKLMEDYQFIDPETNSHTRSPYKPWLDLWNWVELTQLYKMQNADCQIFETYEDKLRNFIKQVAPSLMVYIDKFGLNALFALFWSIVESYKNDDDLSVRGKARLSMRIAMADIDEHKFFDIKNGEYNIQDKLVFLFLPDIEQQLVKEL